MRGVFFSKKKDKDESGSGGRKPSHSEKSPIPNHIDAEISLAINPEKPEREPLPPVGITELFR